MSNKCVFYKEKEQKSIDGGITWVDTGRFRKGALVSAQAAQCGSFVTEYRWTKADYVCDNGNKYKGYKQQVSHDNGGSWVDTGIVDIGELISSNSKDCGYDEKWFTLTGDKDFICDGAAKYKKKEMKYTRDSGTTWNSFDTPTFEKGDLIEEASSDCAPPSMKVKYLDNSEKTFYNLTSIQSDTDSNKTNAKEVEIYNGVKTIGNFAFNGCSSLTGITISESVTSIGNSAFMSCLGLTSVTIPESVTSIEGYAFYGCSNLATMTVKATTPPALGKYAIPDETTRIYVPADSVDKYKTTDGWKDFADKIWAIGYDEKWFTLTGEKDFICSEGSKYKKKEMKYTRNSGTTWNSFDPPKFEKGDLIESNSKDCTGDTGGTTGDTGTTTGGTPSMKVKYLDNSEKTFYNLTSIQSDTDSNKANAEYVEIYDGVTEIGDRAFYECEDLKSVTIPESVTSIGMDAFMSCLGLTSVTIPESVTSIGDRAFYECEDMNSITINAYNPPKLGGTDVFFDSAKKIYVPAASLDAYKSADGWSNYASKIQAIPYKN